MAELAFKPRQTGCCNSYGFKHFSIYLCKSKDPRKMPSTAKIIHKDMYDFDFV